MTASMLLAEYFLTESRAVIMVAGPDDPEPELVTVPCTLASVRSHAGELTAAFESAPREPAALARAAALLAGGLLVDLVAPVVDRLAPGDRLWLVPHDALHRVPLHAVDAGLAGHAVAYAPSASLLRHCRANRGGTRRRALAVTDPPGTAPLTFGLTQAALLGRLFDTETLTGPGAAGAALTGRLAGPRAAEPDDEAGAAGARRRPDILHVGAHGMFDAAAPMRSGVLLADGPFTAEHFLSLRLTGTLVVLAACRTGVTATRPGDELLGLVRSLLHAGAPALLVSLWTVDELATTMLLGRFYEELAGGLSAVDSLHAAQVWLRGISAGDVLAYLAAVAPGTRGEAGARLRVAEARIRLAARDFTGAAEACRAALEAPEDSAVRGTADTLRQRALLLAGRPGEAPDLDRAVYAHPYFWAAFVLIGDWY